MYEVPHPLFLLQNPPAKDFFKTLVKSTAIGFWEVKLRGEASLLPFLIYFNPNFMSLATTQNIWTTAGNKPYEVSNERIQLLFLSSQYPCAQHFQFFTPENPHGLCSFPMCTDNELVESPAIFSFTALHISPQDSTWSISATTPMILSLTSSIGTLHGFIKLLEKGLNIG